MPDQVQGTQGGTTEGQGTQGSQGGQQGAAPPPAAEPKLLPQSEVDRIVAKEVARAKRELGDQLTTAQAAAKAGEDARAKLAELEAKDQTAAEKAAKALEQERQKAATREAELLKTVEATKQRADQDAISAALSKVVTAKVSAENSPDVVQRELARSCKRKDDGKVVWVDPETDQELEPEKALEAYLAAHPCFTVAPASGSGATPGRPPGTYRKPIGQMTSEELKAAADRELSG